MLPWWDLPILIGLGLLAGGLAGLLGIGGGLIFAPLLLWLDLPAHQALATSSFAIVPTALAGTIIHLRGGRIPPATSGGDRGGGLCFGIVVRWVGRSSRRLDVAGDADGALCRVGVLRA